MTELDGVNDWNKQIIAEFRANGGKVGGPFEGATMLLLHHVGARSGTERVTPLVYFPDGDRMVIVASAAGAPKNPDWYHNIKARPRVEVEVGTDRSPSRRRSCVGVDRDEKWAEITAVAPGFAEYQDEDQPGDPRDRAAAGGIGVRVRSGARVHPTGPIDLGPVHSQNGRAR